MSDIQYEIKESDLEDKIDEEVALVADDAFTESGQSLFDAIVIHSNDWNMIKAHVNQAVNTILARFYDVCTVGTSTDEHPTLEFDVPDMPDSFAGSVQNEIERFIVESVSAEWLASRAPQFAKTYSELASMALDKIASMVYTRTAPVRPAKS